MKRKKTQAKQRDSQDHQSKKCGLCGKHGRLTKTDCCGNWICDDEDQYQLFSYARNSCSRNHRRFTVCAVHFQEEHDGPDWRTCEECKGYFAKLEDYVWSATNEYNFVKLENPPAYDPTRCAKCNAIIKLAEEPHSIKGGSYYCAKCQVVPRF